MVNGLPIQYRTIVTLYHLNDFSYKEIAEITGMPDGTIKNYLFRARKVLKDLMNKNRVFSLI
jgi:RNA polymerase sigma factor (sigma-70 family)